MDVCWPAVLGPIDLISAFFTTGLAPRTQSGPGEAY